MEVGGKSIIIINNKNMMEMRAKLNVNFTIMPFGHTSIHIKNSRDKKEKQEQKKPVYAEPKTSNLDAIEITFNESDYVVPKTTGGCL